VKCVCIRERNWLNLETGNPVRVLFFKFSEVEGRIWFCIHHAVADLVSSIIFTREFMSAYAQLRQGRELKWQVFREQRKMLYLMDGYCRDILVPAELDYWTSLPWEKAVIPVSDYPEIFHEPDVVVRAIENKSLIDYYRSELITIDAAQSALLFSQFGQEIESAFIGVFFLAVADWLGLDWLDLDVCNSGRNLLPSEYGINYGNLLGYLSLNRAVLLKRPVMADLAASLKDISDQLKGVPNSGLGYTLIPHYIADEHLRNSFYELRKRPLVFFNYMGRTDSNFGNDEFEISREDCGRLQYMWEVQTNMLECEVRIEEGQLLVKLTYCSAYFKPGTVREIAGRMEQMLHELNSSRAFRPIENVA
jgi:non-ribosomal peptide synthase protein (TIGR01720 family)